MVKLCKDCKHIGDNRTCTRIKPFVHINLVDGDETTTPHPFEDCKSQRDPVWIFSLLNWIRGGKVLCGNSGKYWEEKDEIV